MRTIVTSISRGIAMIAALKIAATDELLEIQSLLAQQDAKMKIKLALFCLSLATASASAADALPTLSPSSQTLAPSVGLKAPAAFAATKSAGIHRVPSPTLSETSVTRRPDGSLAIHCVDKPNPKLRQQMAAQQAASGSVEPQRP